MNKTKAAFLEGRLFPANQSFQKAFQIALIGWIKAGPPKKPSNCSDWLDKSRPSKKATFVLIM